MSDFELTAAEYQEYLRSGTLPSGVITTDKIASGGPTTLMREVSNQEPKVKTELHDFLVHGGYGRVETEYRFHPHRQFRADYYLPEQNPPVLIEYDGITRQGGNTGSAHASINGVVRDSDKGNEAQALGFRFLRANAISLGDGTFYALLDRVLERLEP